MPKAGNTPGFPAGNTDDSKRGRGVSGRDSKNESQSAGGGPSRTKNDPDTDGYPIGGRS